MTQTAAKTKRYVFEGVILDIPLRFDEAAGMYIEEYPDFAENPVFTPQGHPVMLAVEDACAFAEEANPGGCFTCGCCVYYKPASEHTWIGACQHEKMRQLQAR